jgi:hypothetical protein
MGIFFAAYSVIQKINNLNVFSKQRRRHLNRIKYRLFVVKTDND